MKNRNEMRRVWVGSLAALLGCGVLVGCNGQEGENGEAPSADEVMEKTGEAAESAQRYAAGKVDEFRAEMRDSLDALNARIGELESRAEELSGDAKAELDAQLEEIRAQRDAFAERLEKLGDSTERAWEDVKAGTSEAWESLSRSVEQAAARFGGGSGGS